MVENHALVADRWLQTRECHMMAPHTPKEILDPGLTRAAFRGLLHAPSHALVQDPIHTQSPARGLAAALGRIHGLHLALRDPPDREADLQSRTDLEVVHLSRGPVVVPGADRGRRVFHPHVLVQNLEQD